MTGRVCPVHGEYAADGICRWCEPGPKPTNLPAGSTPCRCGEYSWLPECSPDMREGVIAGMFHGPEQCFRLDAEPPAPDAYGESPGARALLDVKRIAEMLGDPHPRWDPAPTFTYAGEDAIAVHWILDFTPAICPEDLTAAFDAEVAAQHAALRWERVARRWANKHGPWTMRDVARHWQFMFDKMVERLINVDMDGITERSKHSKITIEEPKP